MLEIEVCKMEWTKATVQTTTIGTELVTGVLMAAGIPSAEIIDPQDRVRHLQSVSRTWDYADAPLMMAESEDALVVFYVTQDDAGKLLVEDVKNRLRLLGENFTDIGSLNVSLENADEENWAHEWKKHFKPLHFGKVVIVPEWEAYAATPNEVVFTIDPGSAFGTGQHETTRLCIMALQEFLRPGDMMLDVGCGSGILSIIGLLLGAESAFACDIDPAGAIAATNRNAMLNPVDITRLQIHAGDAINDPGLRRKICANKYDIIAANIVADVIIELLPLVKVALKPNGFFIASGIISERLDDVLIGFSTVGLEVHHINELEGWRCVVGKHHA